MRVVVVLDFAELDVVDELDVVEEDVVVEDVVVEEVVVDAAVRVEENKIKSGSHNAKYEDAVLRLGE